MSAEHLAERPSWDCATCGKPWPCDPAREQLVAECGQGTRLALWMQTSMIAAIGDARFPPEELFERFIAWTGPFRIDAPPAPASRAAPAAPAG